MADEPLLLLWLIVIVAIKLTSCSYETMISIQARRDDPHACPWFTSPDGLIVFRCCDGYFKSDAKNLTENCIECPSGKFGFFCNNYCTCENDGMCNKVDGSCHCSAQYFGSSCQYSCNCQNQASCMTDGSCSCVDGFYGALCEKGCSCPENSECDSETGECTCLDGFYGSLCLPCNCSNTQQCDAFSGLCSCRPGYFGEDCDEHCSCFNGAECGNDRSDDCKCSSGWTGAECADCDTRILQLNGLPYCEDKCLHCHNGDRCSVEEGDCMCAIGWQGNKCNQKCDIGFYGRNCSNGCNCEHGSCDHVTGICTCEDGWTGQSCSQSCPENCVLCKGDICTSCKAGWIGELCLHKCKPGTHGVGCKKTCPQCNCTTSCHHINGDCPDVVRCEEQGCKYNNGKLCTENPFLLECQDGWAGHFCDVKTALTITTGTLVDVNATGSLRNDSLIMHSANGAKGIFSRGLIIGICLLVGCIIAIAVGIIVLLYRKSNRSHLGKTQRTMHQSTCISDVAYKSTLEDEGFSSTSNVSQHDDDTSATFDERNSGESGIEVNKKRQCIDRKERHLGDDDVEGTSNIKPQEDVNLLDHNVKVFYHENEGKRHIQEGL